MRDKNAEDLTRKDLKKLGDNFRGRKVSNNYINHFQAYFRAILAWGVDQELIAKNPWRNFKRLPVRRTMVQVSFENFKAVYNQCPEWLKWACKTAFCLALRPGMVELFGLTWPAFNWRRGIVQIRQGKSGMIKTVVPPEEYLQEAHERYLADSKAGIELVCTRNGKHVCSSQGAWESACKKAGVKMRLYDIRHLAASEMLSGGADLAAVAAQLEHASVTTRAKHTPMFWQEDNRKPPVPSPFFPDFAPKPFGAKFEGIWLKHIPGKPLFTWYRERVQIFLLYIIDLKGFLFLQK